MVIIEDVAQKRGKHGKKNEFFAGAGIEIKRYPLPVGDYILEDENVSAMLARKDKRGIAPKKMDFLGTYKRSVDTKYGMQELYADLIQDHERFRDEAELAKANGIKLIILIEEPGIRNADDVRRWNNPRMHRYNKIRFMHKAGKWLNIKEPPKPVDNIQLMKIMHTFAERHGVRWEFCSPEDAGKRIVDLLTAE